MTIATLLLPDFSLILIGFILIRVTDWGTEFWIGLEKNSSTSCCFRRCCFTRPPAPHSIS
ncbi:hypothetical protein ACFS07_06810 [Undibacterium arcticum]